MKIAVGLSGGVDSAVTAALLKEQGHEVVGVFMKNWSDDFGINGECPWEQDQRDAQSVAEHLGIEFLSYNFELQYRERVIEYFFSEYKAGRTPNPDILCNSEIKFNVFLKRCLQELGADKIATGHYARVINNEELIIKNGELTICQFANLPVGEDAKYHLLRGIDQNKDQSYFLCRLTQEELAKSLFPIGEYTKPQVRELAQKFGIPVAQKKDSQGICFVGKINVTEFLRSELGNKPGEIVDIDSGKIVGEHSGLWFYTIGQREGLGLGGGPWFVVKKDLASNKLIIAKGTDNPALFTKEVVLDEINIIDKEQLIINNSGLYGVSLRYRQKPNKAELSWNGDKIKLIFEEPQRAVAPGQFGCIHVGDEVVGSGVIE
jgi:tRNA-specific 2-thiouridylase